MFFREPRLKLLDAVLCEFAVVASGQPCLIVGDLNFELEKIPCLHKGFTGLIFSRLGLLLLALHRSLAVAGLLVHLAGPGGILYLVVLLLLLR